MDFRLRQGHITLDRCGGISLRNAVGVDIACVSGRLWVTFDGDRRDFVLGPGETLAVQRAGLTLVTATEPAQVRVADRRRGAETGALWGKLVRLLDRTFGPSAVRPQTPSAY